MRTPDINVNVATELQLRLLFQSRKWFYNRLARMVAIANLGGPAKKGIKMKRKERKEITIIHIFIIVLI